jgi:hypothetical protein
MPLCNCVANAIRTWYHHCKFFAKGVNFDEDGVEQNWQERGRVFLIKYLQIFLGTLKVAMLRKNTWNCFRIFLG